MLCTFPSQYWSTIGLSGVFSLAGWARRIHARFLVPRATQDTTTAVQASRKGLSPATATLSSVFRSPVQVRHRGPTTPLMPKHKRFGLFPGRSPLLGESLLFSFPAGTKMFQFPAFASDICRITGLQPVGLSHSEIRGSKVICTYPRLFAAYHVLHRLREPRHPPCALLFFCFFAWDGVALATARVT